MRHQHANDRPLGQAVALAVFHEVTDDNLDGQPWPPDGNGYWAVVHRSGGSTTWRRFALAVVQNGAAP